MKKIISLVLFLVMLAGIAGVFVNQGVAGAETIIAGNQNITPTSNGGPAENRTIWMIGNPVTGTGYISQVTTSAYSGFAITSVTVGTFYLTGDNTYKCRDSYYIGTIAGKTNSAVYLSCVAGDILAVYFSGGYMTMSGTGTGNSTWATKTSGGNQIVVGQETAVNTLTWSSTHLGFGGIGETYMEGNPVSVTLEAGDITADSVTLRGEIIDDGNTTCSARFSWGLAGFFDVEVTGNQTGLGEELVTAEVSDLVPATDYWYCFEAWNEAGYSWGGLEYFTTSCALPMGSAEEATNVTATSAQLNAYCECSGFSACTAVFTYSGGGQEGNITYEGNCTADTAFHVHASGLIPDNLYVYWVVLTNDEGDTWGNLIYFQTLEGSEPTTPLVETHPATYVSNTSARLNGHLLYDGDTPGCAVGFQYRVHGTGTWLIGWNSVHSGYWQTDETFSGDLTSLVVNTTYEFRAIAKNGLSDADNPQYGATLEFTTGFAPGVTPRSGIDLPDLGGLVPEPWRVWFHDMSGMGKIVLAVLLNVVGMVFVGWQFKKSEKVAIVVAAAVGIGLFIIFVAIGWYPLWVAFLLGVIVAVVGFLAVVVK